MDWYFAVVGFGGLASCVFLAALAIRDARGGSDEADPAILAWGSAVTGCLGGLVLMLANG